jgi:hypothetical protein
MQVDFFCHHMFYSKVNISIITGFQKVRKVETTGIYPLDKDNMPWQIDSLDIQNDVAVDLFEQNQNSSSEILISTPRFSTTNKKQTENPIEIFNLEKENNKDKVNSNSISSQSFNSSRSLETKENEIQQAIDKYESLNT